jgi:hypothetical protein
MIRVAGLSAKWLDILCATLTRRREDEMEGRRGERRGGEEGGERRGSLHLDEVILLLMSDGLDDVAPVTRFEEECAA